MVECSPLLCQALSSIPGTAKIHSCLPPHGLSSVDSGPQGDSGPEVHDSAKERPAASSHSQYPSIRRGLDQSLEIRAGCWGSPMRSLGFYISQASRVCYTPRAASPWENCFSCRSLGHGRLSTGSMYSLTQECGHIPDLIKCLAGCLL